MSNTVQFDEVDIALLEALRANPRAPWEAVAQAVGVDGATARRRWTRIARRRHAWTTVSTGNWPGQLTALVTGTCRAGTALDVARALAQHPWVVTVETLIGRRDIRCTVVVADLDSLATFLSRDVRDVPDLQTVDSQLIDRVYGQGSNWRPGALRPGAEDALAPVATAKGTGLPRRVHPIDAALVELLVEDARIPASTLAARLGVSETLVRRRLTALVAAGLLVLRVEAPPHLVGLPYSVALWLSVPARDLERAALEIAARPEARTVVTLLAGRANLFTVFWFRDHEQIREIERTVQERYPDVEIVDRSMRLQPVKRMMHLLDEEGLRTGTIPWMPRTPPPARRNPAQRSTPASES